MHNSRYKICVLYIHPSTTDPKEYLYELSEVGQILKPQLSDVGQVLKSTEVDNKTKVGNKQ